MCCSTAVNICLCSLTVHVASRVFDRAEMVGSIDVQCIKVTATPLTHANCGMQVVVATCSTAGLLHEGAYAEAWADSEKALKVCNLLDLTFKASFTGSMAADGTVRLFPAALRSRSATLALFREGLANF